MRLMAKVTVAIEGGHTLVSTSHATQRSISVSQKATR